MKKDLEKLFTYFEPATPEAGLFDRIILAIKKEKGRQQARKIFFSFFALLIVSIITIPFSLMEMVNQAKNSGTIYFLSTIINNFGNLVYFWQDSALAILESLPITGIIIFSINLALLLFTIRLFLYKRGLLLKYLYG